MLGWADERRKTGRLTGGSLRAMGRISFELHSLGR